MIWSQNLHLMVIIPPISDMIILPLSPFYLAELHLQYSSMGIPGSWNGGTAPYKAIFRGYIALNNSPYIGLIYVRYLQSFGSWNGHWYSPTWKWLLLVWPIGDSPNPKHQSNKPWGRCNTPVYTYNVGPPSDVRWFINTMNTIVIGTINHSYWSYLHQLSYRSGAPLCGLWLIWGFP